MEGGVRGRGVIPSVLVLPLAGLSLVGLAQQSVIGPTALDRR